jgi:hypothetical protein
MLSRTMASDPDLLSPLLVQLDRIAKAPMTGQERELRANSLLGANVEPGELAGATASEELAWSATKASEHGVSAALWLRAVQLAAIPASASVAELLERMHRADAIAAMLKAGYEAGVDPLPIIWSGKG